MPGFRGSLVFHAREPTKDIDALLAPATDLRQAARAVAAREDLPEGWLNAVKGFFSSHGRFEVFEELSHLRVYVPNAEYLFAMKCLALRLGDEFRDLEDVRVLVSAVGIRNDIRHGRAMCWKNCRAVNRAPTRAQLRRQYRGETLLFDAVVKASKGIMLKQQGRKALIVISDGGENGSDASLAESIDPAHRADTLIDSILFGGTEGKGNLQRMPKETGGCFEPSTRFGIDEVFAAIQGELRSQYNIGCVAYVPVRISGFRTLRVTTLK